MIKTKRKSARTQVLARCMVSYPKIRIQTCPKHADSQISCKKCTPLVNRVKAREHAIPTESEKYCTTYENLRTVESTHPTGAWDLYDCTMSHDFSDNAIIDFTDLDWIGRGGPRSKRTSTPHSASAMRSTGGCRGRIPPFLPRLAAPATREPPIPRRSSTRRRSAARPDAAALRAEVSNLVDPPPPAPAPAPVTSLV